MKQETTISTHQHCALQLYVWQLKLHQDVQLNCAVYDVPSEMPTKTSN